MLNTRDSEDEKASTFASNKLVDSPIDIEAYRPLIQDDRSWVLSELDLGTFGSLGTTGYSSCAEWIADGCGVLGTGGGGSPYPPYLVARQLLREGKKIFVSRCTTYSPRGTESLQCRR